MNRKSVITHVKRKYNIEPDYPFAEEYSETAVFRHKDTRKWFALCMEVRADRLGYDYETEWIDVITMKSEPLLIDGMVSREGFHRAHHMNKKQWLTVELNDKISDDEIKNLIALSFELTDKKKRSKAKKCTL